ncbi:MAG: hypothetical protein QXI58_05165 [Candidatus Micrarchaeia archaeon]
MRIYEKLHFVFFLIAAAYVGLVIFGFVDYERTESVFLLILLMVCFSISYFLTKEYIWQFNNEKLIGT